MCSCDVATADFDHSLGLPLEQTKRAVVQTRRGNENGYKTIDLIRPSHLFHGTLCSRGTLIALQWLAFLNADCNCVWVPWYHSYTLQVNNRSFGFAVLRAGLQINDPLPICHHEAPVYVILWL